MSDAVSIERAAAGELPDWAEVGPSRRAHIARVAALLEEWADCLGLDPRERARWRAAGWLHDALRDADPATLRAMVSPEVASLPGPLLHGPAAADRLRAEGVDDEAVLRAVAYHTLGHPSLDRLGRALYIADYLEPGRRFDPVGRAALRARMPEALDAVLIDVVASRLSYLLDRRIPLRPESVTFWNSLVADS